MAIREILTFPDPRLRTKAHVVTDFNTELATLIDDMFETMYHDRGIGLAATQINVHQRVITMDLQENNSKTPLYLINPELIHTEGESLHEEGCLSVPDVYAQIKRYSKVRVKSFDKQGQVSEFDAEDLLAICIQHEIDHLNGKLFIDHLSNIKRERVIRLLKKRNKERM
jgi:peptide deformylase